MPSLLFVTLAVFLGICLLPVALLRRKSYPRAQDFFVASAPTPPAVIKNASIAYALKTAAFGPLLVWGATGDLWPAIISAVFLGLGLWLLYVLRRPLLAFLGGALDTDRSITINAFVAEKHGGDARVRLVAAALTVFALTGLIVCETVGVAAIAKPLLPDAAGLVYLVVCAVLAAMVACVAVAGNSGAMYAGQLQLGALYFGLFGSLVFLVYVQMSSLSATPPHAILGMIFITGFCVALPIFRRSRFVDSNIIQDLAEPARRPTFAARLLRMLQKILSICISFLAAFVIVVAGMDLFSREVTTLVHESGAALAAGTRVPLLGLVALALFPLFYQVVDLSNWQRVAAFAKDRDANSEQPEVWSAAFRKFLVGYSLESPFAWLFMCAFGAAAAVSTAASDPADFMQAFIEQLVSQENSIATAGLVFLLIGVLAMALSTMIGLFSANLSALRYDLLPALWPAAGRGKSAEATARTRAVAVGVALCLVILVAFYVVEERLHISFTSSRFIGLVFAFGCAQLAFVPLVLGPLIGGSGKSGTVQAGWALGILTAGAAAGVAAIAIYFATANEAWLWAAVPACLGTGAVIYAAARLRSARPA